MADLPTNDKPVEQPVTDQPASEPTASTNSEAQPAPENTAADKPDATTEQQEPATPAKPTSKRILFIIGGLFIIGLSALFAYFLSTGSQSKTSETNTTANNEIIQPTRIPEKDKTSTDINNPQAFSKTLVYGAWSGQTSLIKAVELSSNTTTLLASLPSSIKKVSILSAQTLLYIDQTDKSDHGKQLVIYNLKSKSPQGSIPATPGFGIDDYVLSPDKNYVAIWEVSFAPNSQVLQGGKSRVYAVDLSRPTVKKLLYDETAGSASPVHYPIAILNNGKVFADKFLPNDPSGGAGWAYGLSVVDFEGSDRQDLPQMLAGTYGTQPSLSQDGKYLVFAGYDGSNGDGKSAANGYRQALLTPNTVELLNTESYDRTKLPNLDSKNIYSAAAWDKSSGEIILTVVAENSATTGVYAYDLNVRQLEKITTPSNDAVAYGFLTKITDNTTIIGTQDTNASNLGNLGDNYAFPFTQIALLDRASTKVSFIALQDTFAQYITVLPSNYFKDVLGIEAQAQTIPKPTFVDLFSGQNEAKKNQQLYTFIVKYDLAATRLKQQSISLNEIDVSPGFKQNKNSPTCENLAIAQCEAQGVTQASSAKDTYKSCVRTNKLANESSAKSEGKCHDSPLYLYGAEGQNVHVAIQTPISKAIPSSTNGSYDVTLETNGNFNVHGNTYNSIAYDYISNLKRMTAPKTGIIVKQAEVSNVLKHYAEKLGLNQKETADLLSAGKQKASGPYVFVSFFDQSTSEQILPITFNPAPDNYLNVVFYFKNVTDKPNYTPLPPVFPEPIERNGFTAVEISEIVE